MRLLSYRYREFEGKPRAWHLDELLLGNINLIVGRNASGKSRALNILNNIARLVSGRQPLTFTSGDALFNFGEREHPYVYHLHYENQKVVEESVQRDSDILLQRGHDGTGIIYAEKEHRTLDFQSPENQLAALARQDAIQHSFLAPLSEWANSVFHYQFGTPLGKYTLAMESFTGQAVDLHDPEQVVGIFRQGKRTYGHSFVEAIIQDMMTVGYNLEELNTGSPESFIVRAPVPVSPIVLRVKERELPTYTEQAEISQGMFRALSTLINLNYALLSGGASTVLIDDIGEGLDFERSCALIKVLIDKASAHGIQLIMTTNDRFVMNQVPLEYWTVLERHGAHVKPYNFENARKQFEEFKFTGLNNFEFFAGNFVTEGGPTAQQ